MDFGIREVLILIGVIFFFAIVADAVRRFLDNRKKQLKLLVKPGKVDDLEDDDDIDWYAGELPGGGARLRSRSDDDGIDMQSEAPSSRNQRTQSDPEFSEPYDILMAGDRSKNAQSSPPVVTVSETESIKPLKQESVKQEPVLAPGTRSTPPKSASATREKNQWDLFGKEAPESELVNSQPNKNLPEEILAINVMAKGTSDINGDLLLQAAEAFGLRYGDMHIFHRHEHSSGQGAIIFSMANALNPGTFDNENMPYMHFKGVTFFMRLSQIKKRIFVLELMLDIARRMADQLNAELKDDTHSVLSSQTVSHYKSRIHEYERRYLGQVLRNDN